MAVLPGFRQVLSTAFGQVRWLVLLALLLASVSAALRTKEPTGALLPGEIDLQAVSSLQASAILWIDARSRTKFQSRHIPGAVPLNSAEWDSLIAEFYDRWQPEHQVVVYGEVDSDNANEVASRLREESALENVWVLKGGYEAWRAR